MDKSTRYRQLLIEQLEQHGELLQQADGNGVRTHYLFDRDHDQYMLYRIGWSDKKRVQIPFLYVRLENDKFWIEEDYTEDGLATELLADDVPNQDIVLAFRHPSMREYTEFALA